MKREKGERAYEKTMRQRKKAEKETTHREKEELKKKEKRKREREKEGYSVYAGQTREGCVANQRSSKLKRGK